MDGLTILSSKLTDPPHPDTGRRLMKRVRQDTKRIGSKYGHCAYIQKNRRSTFVEAAFRTAECCNCYSYLDSEMESWESDGDVHYYLDSRVWGVEPRIVVEPEVISNGSNLCQIGATI